MRNYDPPDPSSSAQIAACKLAIMREYGKVIGEQQAENIAYHVLIAARGAAAKDAR